MLPHAVVDIVCRVTHIHLGTPNIICHVLDSECVRSMQVELVYVV